MKTLLYALLFCLFTHVAQAQQHFGETITEDQVANPADLLDALAETGSTQTKVSGEVTGVCQMKGCWMTINMGNNQEMMVRFKDYGFFVPKDITGQTVVIEGEALMDTVSVEDQQHYAKDAGLSEEEINAITEPVTQLSFVADGVIIREKE